MNFIKNELAPVETDGPLLILTTELISIICDTFMYV
jgi:hypothetical protein